MLLLIAVYHKYSKFGGMPNLKLFLILTLQPRFTAKSGGRASHSAAVGHSASVTLSMAFSASRRMVFAASFVI